MPYLKNQQFDVAVIYIPFIYFFALLVFHLYREKNLGLGGFLLVLYGVSALLSIFLFQVEFLRYVDIEIKLSSVLVYCGVLTLYFLPFMLYGQGQPPAKVLLPNMKIFMWVSIFLIAVNLVAVLLLIKATIYVLGYDPKLLRETGIKGIYSPNIFESIGMWLLGHFSDFYLLLLVFFFYSKTYLKNSFWFNLLLLLSSMSTIVNGFLSGGRTQLIYWLLAFIACFLYFKRDMQAKEKRRVTLGAIVIVVLMVIYMTVVTISRFNNVFSDATDYAEAFSLLDYSGQSFLNFNDFFVNYEDQRYTFARIFPFLHDWFSIDSFDLAVYKRSIKMDIGVFPSFLGDFYIDLGIWGIIIYTIIYLAIYIFSQISNIHRSKKIQHIIMLFLMYQVPLNGVFYYSLYNKTASIAVIGGLIIALLFRFSEQEVIEEAGNITGAEVQPV